MGTIRVEINQATLRPKPETGERESGFVLGNYARIMPHSFRFCKKNYKGYKVRTSDGTNIKVPCPEWARQDNVEIIPKKKCIVVWVTKGKSKKVYVFYNAPFKGTITPYN